MRLILAFLATALLAATVIAQTAADDVRLKEAMGETSFKNAGLDKLSASELAALEAWINGKRPASDAAASILPPVAVPAQQPRPRSPEPAAATPEPEGSFGLPEAPKSRPVTEIRSRITGDFNGWTGKTLFELDNGQVWIQRLKGKSFVRLNNPEIVITRNFLGYYKLTVIETGRSIGVKRIK